METLKSIGYVIAALIVVAVVLSGGFALAILVVTAGALFSLVVLIGVIAAGIKEYWESR